MTSRRKKKHEGQTSLKEFITVAYAEDMDLAKQYKKMLSDEDIPVAIKESHDTATHFSGVAVMVPEDYMDEAHLLIQSQTSYDFYESAFQDDYEEVDENLYDDF